MFGGGGGGSYMWHFGDNVALLHSRQAEALPAGREVRF